MEATNISAGLVPSGFVTVVHTQFSGTTNFDGAGNAVTTLNGTYLSIPFDHTTVPVEMGTFSMTCNETYTVNPDLTVAFSATGGCNSTFTGGPSAGATGTINNHLVEVFVNANGDTLRTTASNGQVEKASNSTGYSADRVCTNNTTWIRQ